MSYSSKYDRLVSFFQPNYTKSNTGEDVISWSSVLSNIPCSVDYTGGNITNEESQRVSENSIVFTIRYPFTYSILTTYEASYLSERYTIHSVQEAEKGRRVELKIIASKKDNQ